MKHDHLELCLLFDFYGEMLTDKQRELFDLYYNEDLSLSEIAEHAGITRQGVRDAVVRAEHTLTALEDKLHLVEKFVSIKEKIHRIRELTGHCEAMSKQELVTEVEHISQEILEEL